jgi:alpha-galactosidase
LLDRLRAAHPAVEIESCASGGGRVDYSILARCTRFWASDNNDPIERLRINRSWLQFLPLRTCGHHVGPSPNPVTGRALPMDFRAKVALFGHMGVEADPGSMTPDERRTLAAHVALYRQWRDVLHEGELGELAVDDPGVCGWVAVAGPRALALVAQTAFARHFEVAPVRIPGLDPARLYRVTLPEPWPDPAARYLGDSALWRDGLVISGAALAHAGLALPLRHPCTAWLIALEAE